MEILLNGWILPIGGVYREGSVRSLQSRLVCCEETDCIYIVDRPGVARAVLQTALYLKDSSSNDLHNKVNTHATKQKSLKICVWIFFSISPKQKFFFYRISLEYSLHGQCKFLFCKWSYFPI